MFDSLKDTNNKKIENKKKKIIKNRLEELINHL